MHIFINIYFATSDPGWTQVVYSKRQEVAELKASLKRLLFHSASICQDRSRFIDVMRAFNKYEGEVSEAKSIAQCYGYFILYRL